MDKSEIIKWTHRTYLAVSGVYLAYSIFCFSKKMLRKHKNSLASVHVVKRKQQEQKQISKEEQQQLQPQTLTESSVEESESIDYWKIESIAENKLSNQSHNTQASLNHSDEQQSKSATKLSSIPSKTKNNSVINLVELTTVLPKAIVEEEKHKIIKVCLTGGPCAGKTSGMAFLSEKLRDDEFHVFVVPEAATLIANGGGMLDFGGYTTTDILNFQKALMQVQIALEDQFYRLAQLSKAQSIILCDRGLLDGKAFLTSEQWEQLLKDLKFSEQNLRDERYDSIIHLVTAADGAADYYVQEGARFQNLEQAVEIDKKFQEAWLGHQQLEIIDNKSVSNFEEKLEKLLFTVRKLSGVPVKGQKLYKRYVIIDPESHPNLPDDLQVESFEIEDTFLYKAGYNEQEGKLTKIRKRIQGNDVIYMCSESHVTEGKQTIFFKKRLNYREYLLVKNQQDRERQTIRKNRRQFVYAGYFYSLDKFKDFDMCILRLKNSSGIDESDVVIPDFLQVDGDVTEHSEFKSLNLSLKHSPLRDTEQLHEIVNDLYQTQKHIVNFQQRLRPRISN